MANSNINPRFSFTGILKPVSITFAVVILLFALFELMDQLWLKDLEMAVRHNVYLARGITISLTAVFLVGWLVVKASTRLLRSEDWSENYRPVRSDRLANFTNWFILMRWIAICMASVLIYIVVQINQWLPGEVWYPLLLTLGALAVLNAFYTYLASREGYNRYLLPVQTYADIIILTILLHYSGGIENPFTLMLLVHVFIAGIVLTRSHLYAVTATVIGLLIIMAAGEATGLLPHYTLNTFPHFEEHGIHIHAAHQPLYVISYVGLMITIILLSSYFIGTIMNRIRHDEQQLERFADQTLEQRQLLEQSLATTGTGLCVCDNHGEPFWINQIWHSWFGDHPIDPLFRDQPENESHARIRDTLQDGITRVGELTHTSEDEERIYQITTAPLIDKNGQVDHAVSLARDITE